MEVKRIDLLVRAFARIAESFPAAELHVYGEGPLYASLKWLIDELDLSNRIRLCGYTQSIEEVYGRAMVFCSASAAEGFPRALSEAMNSGLPCVVMEDCRGALLLAKGGEAALVAAVDENGEDLSAKIAALLHDPQLRRRLSEAALSRASEFASLTVFDQWERMLCGGNESPRQVATLADA
jgi:glycosyltransferase involved in cell wall biosynthesis